MKSVCSIQTLLIPLAFLTTSLVKEKSVFAQIVPDNTLGAESSQVVPQNANSDLIEGGAARGANLFHSFQEFNVDDGRGAFFANPDGIENIFSRVTGANPSNILGTLGVEGAANLFLINPNGIIFGNNAALDLQGSFTATTADAVTFNENGLFSAVNPEDSVLTISVPLGLQLGSNPGSIINSSVAEDPDGETNINDGATGLQVPEGETLSFIGGEILLDGGNLTARGGHIELGSADSSLVLLNLINNQFEFDYSLVDSFGNITLENTSVVDVTSGNGGSISVTGENITLDQSSIFAGVDIGFDSVSSQSGDITLNAQGFLNIVNGGSISNDVNFLEAIGNAGNVEILAQNVSLTDGSFLRTSTFGNGNSGRIVINASESVILGNEVSSQDAVNLDFPNGSGFLVSSVESGALGDSQGIEINTDFLVVRNSSQIRSEVIGQGHSGDIDLNVIGSVSFSGRDNNDFFPSGIFTGVATDGAGNGGNINIQAQSLEITDRAQFVSNVQGNGNAGNINIVVEEDFRLDNSILIAEITEGLGEGQGGNISIQTGSLLLQNGSAFLADTENVGNAGNISIQATDSIVLEGEGLSAFPGSTGIVFSQISSTVESQAIGAGGNIDINSISLSLSGDAFISTSTFGIGDAGNINVTTGDLFLTEGSQIIASSSSGSEAGDITFSISDFIQLTDSEISTTSTQSSGGDLTINAPNADILLRGDSDISTDLSFGLGNGGNITITADSIFAFDDSDIFAFAAEGQGGNINLNTDSFFAESFTLNSLTADPEILDNNGIADVNATGEVSGGVVDIPDVSFLQNALNELNNNNINTEQLLANSCVVPNQKQEGTFLITGRGGLAINPDDESASTFSTGEVQTIAEKNTSYKWRTGDPIVEPQGVYRLSDGRLVMSRECKSS